MNPNAVNVDLIARLKALSAFSTIVFILEGEGDDQQIHVSIPAFPGWTRMLKQEDLDPATGSGQHLLVLALRHLRKLAESPEINKCIDFARILEHKPPPRVEGMMLPPTLSNAPPPRGYVLLLVPQDG